MKKFILMSFAASLSLTVIADEKPKVKEEMAKAQIDFSMVDTNSDGFIDMTESSKVPHLPSVFKKLDTDADQKLNKDEYSVFLKAAK